MPIHVIDNRDPLQKLLDEERILTGIAAGSRAIIFCERPVMLQLENQLEHLGADCRKTDSLPVAKRMVMEAIRNNEPPTLIAWKARSMDALKTMLQDGGHGGQTILSVGGESCGCLHLDLMDLDDRRKVTETLLQALDIPLREDR